MTSFTVSQRLHHRSDSSYLDNNTDNCDALHPIPSFIRGSRLNNNGPVSLRIRPDILFDALQFHQLRRTQLTHRFEVQEEIPA